jgi:hypothetical protein
MEPYTSCLGKKLKLATAVALTATLLLSGAGCAKDENPPVIQQADMPEWAVEDENINLSVRTADDRGVKEVYVQFDSGDKIPLTKLDSHKNGEEVTNWQVNLNLAPNDYTYSIIAADRANEAKKEGKISVYQEDADGDGLAYREELKYGTDPNKKNPVAKYLLDKNMGILIPDLKHLEQDGVMVDDEKAFVDVLVVYQPRVNQILPELYGEIMKLPDLLAIEGKDAEAVEDILALASDPKYKSAFESIINEGIKDKRKYCSPLEALLWIAYDRKFDKSTDNPLEKWSNDSVEKKSLEKLIKDAWRNTSTSNNYKSDRWENFDEVVDRLSSPELVTRYMLDNISYDCTEWRKYSETEWPKYLKTGKYPKVQTTQQIFTDKSGCCVDHAMSAFYCLSQNGYMYDNFDVYKNNATSILIVRPMFNSTVGHATCLYVQDGEFYIIDTGRSADRGIKGPFKTIEEAVDATFPFPWCGVYMFFNLDSNGDLIMDKLVERK